MNADQERGRAPASEQPKEADKRARMPERAFMKENQALLKELADGFRAACSADVVRSQK
jgi:hypothetical protein